MPRLSDTAPKVGTQGSKDKVFAGYARKKFGEISEKLLRV